ncbi:MULTISPECIES: MFS transporter [unclassified Streptomyces]|uniref:MFS transporter n=1 Tax=unclassified Streptomyces TaxID=2593676 RepID=UPI002E189EA6|nr:MULTISPECIES: MFS transporter [unclassified Streptomyces]
MSRTAPAATAEVAKGAGRRGRSHALLLTALIVAVIAFQLGASMVTPALPEIAREFDVSAAQVAGAQDLFFLVGGVAGVVLGRLSDRVGRRRILLAAMVTMCLGALIAALAPSVPVLIAGRILQGASGATFPVTYMLLRDTMSPARFGPALGLVTAINGGVGGLDGLMGGIVADTVGFRWIFGAILVVGLTAIVLVLRFLPETAPKDGRRMDWWGAAALSAALVCVNLALSKGSAHGWSAPLPLALLLAALTLLIVFWQLEKRRTAPLIAVEHLRSRQVWPLLATTLLTLMGVFSAINFTFVLLSQDGEFGYGMSATLSSLLYLTPPAAIGLLSAPLTGWLAPRKGWLVLLRTGLGLSLLILLGTALLPDNRWLLFAAACALGIAYNGLAMTPLNALGVVVSPKDAPGAVPGINAACFGIGSSVGIALVAPAAGSGTLGGIEQALWISAGFTFLALLAACVLRLPASEGGDEAQA